MNKLSGPIALLLAWLAFASTTGCGGGGGGSSSTAGGGSGPGTAGTTSGAAVKGPFLRGSPVKIFRVTGGQQGDLIGTGTVGDGGTFSIRLADGSYSGPLLFSVSGSYSSESGGTDTISETNPIFGFLPSYSAGTTEANISVTPLTHLALQLALGRGPLGSASMQSASDEIGTRFGLTNIGRTVPADPTAAGSQDSPALRYGLVLAGLTQQAQIKSVSTEALIASLGSDAADGSLDGQAASGALAGYSSSFFTSDLAAGVDSFVQSTNNRSNVTETPTELKQSLTRALVSIGNLALPSLAARGQIVTATVLLANTGGNPARIDAVTLTPSQSGVSVTASASNPGTLGAGQSAVFTFSISIDSNAPPGTPTFQLRVDATDTVTNQPAGAARSNAGSLAIQEPSSVSIGNLQTPGTVVRGGSFSVLMPVTNSGGAAATLESAALTFSVAGFGAQADSANPVRVEAGDSVALRFIVTVGSGVAPGNVTIDARVTSRDTASNGTGEAVLAGAGVVRVLSPAALAIGTILGSGPLVAGQTIVVSLPVTNSGESVATIQSVTLGFGTTDLTVTPLSGNPGSISPGITSLFRFRVTAGANTAGRSFTASATAQGTDSSSGASVSAPPRGDAGTLVIVRPATLSIGSLALPASVSVGQTFTATLSVTNTGESTADIGLVSVTFDNPGVNTVAGVSNPGSILPGATQTFRVSVLVSSNASPGPVVGSVAITAVDRLSGASASTSQANLATVNVLTRAALAPLSVAIAPLVSKGQTTVATLTVQNAGQARATITAASLTFSDRNITAAARADNPASVAGNATAQLRFDVTIGSAAASGIATIGASISGKDANSSAQTGGSVADAGSTLVQTPAALSVSTVSGPARLSQGQTFTATATIANLGEAAVRLSAASLTFSNPNVTASVASPSPLPTLGQGQSVLLRFSGTVGAAAAPGPITAVFEASGRDVNSSATVRASQTQALSATVDTPAAVSVVSLVPSTGTVSQGQQFTASLTLRNSGSATAVLTAISLDFGSTGLTAPAASTPVSLAGNGSLTTLVFQLSAASAAAGAASFSSRVKGFDQNSLTALTVAAGSAAVLVQTRAALRVSGLAFSRPAFTMTQAQSASITLTLTNDGQAGADVSSAQLLFDRAVLSAAGQSVNQRIAGGASRSFVFGVTASPTLTAVVKVDGDATALDANSRASVAVTRGNTLTITVQRPAGLTLDRIDVRRTVTLGQVTAATMVFRNSGEAALTLTAADVVRNLPLVNLSSFSGSVAIAGGRTAPAVVNMTAVALGAVTLTSATAQATEDNTGKRLTIVNGMTLPPTITVQEPPGIRVDLPQVPAFVSIGQTFSVTAMIANTGEAPLVLTAATAAFRPPPTLPATVVTNLASLTIPGFTTAPVVFSVTVPVTETAGVRDLDLDATGQDANTGLALPTATRSPAAQVTLQTTPQLSILPLVKQGTASRGQTFTVTIPVRNLGQATARVTAATLVWSKTKVTSALAAGQTLDVPGGTTGTVAMTVTVASDAPLGPVTSVATVDAIDVNSRLALPRLSFASSVPTTIEAPAALSIVSYKGPSRVSQGQSFTATVGVKNLGGALARIRDATLVWSRPGITATLTSPATPTFVTGGSSVTTTVLQFTCFVDAAAQTGLTTGDVTVSANDANGELLDITAFAPRIASTTVQTKATPLLVSLGTPPTISQGQTARVSLTVTNTGEARVLLDPPTLSVLGNTIVFSARASNPTSIAGLASAALSFDLTVSASATPGTTDISVQLSAHDENNPGPTIVASNPSIRQIVIQRPPQLTLGDLISVPAHVSRGQLVKLSLPVTNPPDAATARFNGPSLAGSAAGVSTVTTPPSPSVITSGQTTNLVFLTSISSTATTGTIFLQGIVPFIDANTGLPAGTVTRNPVGQLDVQLGAKLSLGQSGARTSVTQGQSFSATIAALNQSGGAGAAATGTAAVLVKSDSTFSATLTQPPGTINGGDTANSTLNIATTNPATTLGTKSVFITYTARDANSGLITPDTTASLTVSFIVQRRPTLTAQSPTIPATISRGELKVPVSISFTNGATDSATALVTAVSFKFLAGGSTDESARYTPTFVTALPLAIGGGATGTVKALFDVGANASLGALSVTADISAQDANDSAPLTVPSPAGTGSSVVAAKPVLKLAGPTNALPAIFPAQSTLSTGQTVQFRMEVRNFGAANANITGGSLSFFSGFVNKTSEYTVALVSGAGTLGVGSTGNTSAATLVFNVTPSSGAAGFGTISVGGTVVATASSGGADVTTSITPPVTGGTFVLQKAVSLTAPDIFFDPILPTGVDRASTTTPGDIAFSLVSVRVRVNNSNGPSGASMLISAATLELKTGAVSVDSEYSVTGPAGFPLTLAGNATAFLTFTVAAKPTAQKAVIVSVVPKITAADANIGSASQVSGTAGSWIVRDKAKALVGQPDFQTATSVPPAAGRINGALAAISDGVRLFVADTQNSRVLIFPSLTATTPVTCLGQASFTAGAVNGGGAAGSSTLNAPSGLAISGTKLVVIDGGNNRGLVFNNYTTLPQFSAPADAVFGQADFTSNIANRTGAVSADGLSNPRSAVVIAGKLLVSDSGNSRVLLYDQIPTNSSNTPTVVIGQTGMTGGSVNMGGANPSAASLAFPAGLGTDGQRLFVADQGNDRVLVFSPVPSANGASAGSVLGHVDFVSGTASKPTTDGGLSRPTGVTAALDKIFVADQGNNRVVVFLNPSPPTLPAIGATALDLFGQSRFTESGANNSVSGTRDAFSLSSPADVATTSITDAARLFVVDSANHRILVVPVP
ncbi:MAG: hypothetical protein HY816_11015 [Candidatus Wallbacteria bacterium]|nr:hypothetical protein [Candidatus Wallbacteria bacterium]